MKHHPWLCLRFVAAVAILLTVPANANAQDADNDSPQLTLGGSFFTRYEVRENFSDVGLAGRRLGEGDGAVYRARLNLRSTDIDVGNGLTASVLFAPQAAGYWGDVSGGLTDLGLGTHEAKLRIGWGDSWLDVGRFEMIYGEHLIIGNVDWNEFGRSFDGARLRMAVGEPGSYIDVFATQVAEGGLIGATEPFGSGDTYFLGIYAGIGPTVAPNLVLDVYSLFLIDPRVTETVGPAGPMDGDAAAELTLGTRALYTLDPVVFRIETGLQLGERVATDQDMVAWHVDADVTATVAEGVKAIVGGQYASGDDPDTADTFEGWNQLFPTAHKFLGLTDVIGGRTNIASVFVKGRWKALPRLSFAADQHVFFRPQTPDGIDAYTAVETDIWGLYRLGRGLGLRAQYSLLVGNEDGPLLSNSSVHYVEVQLRLDF